MARIVLTAAVCLHLALSSSAVWPQAESTSNTVKFAADDDRHDGDHLILRTNAYGFEQLDGAEAPKADAPKKCAPVGSKMSVRQDTGEILVVRFYDVPDKKRAGVPDDALTNCPPDKRVNTYTSYKIRRDTLAQYDFKRTGIVFGGLVIPFKYRLGGDKGITASSTVAPYVGLRTALFQGFGLSFNPIASAGLGLVPVHDATSDKTETKSAFSVAFGLVMTSSKNDKFNAGLIFGRDLLSSADRERDPNVNKPWLSFYLGISL